MDNIKMTEQELKKALTRGLEYIDKAANLAKRTVRKVAKDNRATHRHKI